MEGWARGECWVRSGWGLVGRGVLLMRGGKREREDREEGRKKR